MSAGVFVYAVYKNSKNEKLSFAELCGAALLGGAMGILPDILEPAKNNPHHRRIFHSLALLSCFLLKDGLYDEFQLNERQRDFCNIALSGYSSHLIVDSFSPRSLPIIGLKKVNDF
jgi:membrane-bound metal-dependent hydrolase YbcI (DUF457 family)